jgi:hypothetical protein
MRRPAVILCVTVLAGCGGDESNDAKRSSSGGGDHLSKAEFVEQGTRICEQSAKKSQQVAKDELAKPDVQKLPGPEQRLHVALAATKPVEDALADLEALDAPADVEPHVKTLTGGVRETVAVLEEVQDAAKAGDQAKLSDLTTKLAGLAERTRTAASKAGLQACLPENTA